VCAVAIVKRAGQVFFTFVNKQGEGDISQQLKSLFAHEVADSNALRVLCAVHQKVIFPPHYYCKQKIEHVMGTDFRYQDDKGCLVCVYLDALDLSVFLGRSLVGRTGDLRQCCSRE
jgi:hypothetical protein